MKGGGFSCEQEWQPVVFVIFVRFWHVGGGCGGVFCRNSLKLRITIQPVMQIARVVENLFLRFITGLYIRRALVKEEKKL